MGFFRKCKKSVNEGRQKTIDESYRRRKQEEKVSIPVELVDPNWGRFVTLRITTEEGEFLKGIYMRQLTAYARSVKNLHPDTVVTLYNDRVTIEMEDEKEARKIRAYWEKRL